MARIHLIGSGGSGRTTLAQQLAAQPAWVSEGGVWWVGRPAWVCRHDCLARPALDPLLHWTLCWRRIVTRHIKADLACTNAYPGFRKMFRFAACPGKVVPCRRPQEVAAFLARVKTAQKTAARLSP